MTHKQILKFVVNATRNCEILCKKQPIASLRTFWRERASRLAAGERWGCERTNHGTRCVRPTVVSCSRAQSAFCRRDMLTTPCFGVLLVPPIQTFVSVQNKQFLGHFLWDPQCFLRLRSLHVNAINPYVGIWTGNTALHRLRQPVTMETRYIRIM